MPYPSFSDLIECTINAQLETERVTRILQAAVLDYEAGLLAQDRRLAADEALRLTAVEFVLRAGVRAARTRGDEDVKRQMVKAIAGYEPMRLRANELGLRIKPPRPVVDLGIFAPAPEPSEQNPESDAEKQRALDALCVATRQAERAFTDAICQHDPADIFVGAEQRRLNQILILREACETRKGVGQPGIRSEMTQDLILDVVSSLADRTLDPEARTFGMKWIGAITRTMPAFSNALDSAERLMTAVLTDPERAETLTAIGRALPPEPQDVLWCLRQIRELRDKRLKVSHNFVMPVPKYKKPPRHPGMVMSPESDVP